MSEKTIFNDFCASKKCTAYVVWDYSNFSDERPILCESCSLMGQSHFIAEYPPNCLFLKAIQAFEKSKKEPISKEEEEEDWCKMMEEKRYRERCILEQEEREREQEEQKT
jgi:hypothetical protein